MGKTYRRENRRQSVCSAPGPPCSSAFSTPVPLDLWPASVSLENWFHRRI